MCSTSGAAAAIPKRTTPCSAGHRCFNIHLCQSTRRSHLEKDWPPDWFEECWQWDRLPGVWCTQGTVLYESSSEIVSLDGAWLGIGIYLQRASALFGIGLMSSRLAAMKRSAARRLAQGVACASVGEPRDCGVV